MGALVKRTLDWIDVAPTRVEARAESTAAPAAVFSVLADHETWPEWFPSVKKVEVTGAAAGVGARRRVFVPGARVDEEFIVWEPGERWTFTGLDARPRFTRSLIEDCILEPRPSGGTAITYTMYLDLPRLVRPFASVLAGRIRANNTRALENLAARAADSTTQS